MIAYNRDETKKRPSVAAHLWPSNSIYGGKDVVTDGTWLATSTKGRFAALLNVLHEKRGICFSKDKSTRGGLVPNFLNIDTSSDQYIDSIRETSDKYNWFNLVMCEFKAEPKVSVFNNYQDRMCELHSGVLCLSNLPPDFDNNRCTYGKEIFNLLLKDFSEYNFPDHKSRNKYLKEQLFGMLADKTEIPPMDGLHSSTKYIFNSEYVDHSGEGSGSVSSTVFFVDKNNHCYFAEKTNFVDGNPDGSVVEFKWDVTE